MNTSDIADQNLGLWVKGIPYFLSGSGPVIPSRYHLPNDVMTNLSECEGVKEIYRVLRENIDPIPDVLEEKKDPSPVSPIEQWKSLVFPLSLKDIYNNNDELYMYAPRLEGRLQYFLRGTTPEGLVTAKVEKVVQLEGKESIIPPKSDEWCALPLLVCSTFKIKDWITYIRRKGFCNNASSCTKFSHRLAKSLIRIASTRIFATPEQSILELPVNSLDSYDPERKVGKFGMGFFSILYWLVEHPKREMIINSFFRGEGESKSYICHLKYTPGGEFMFNLNFYKSCVKRTGTHILLLASEDPFTRHNLKQFKQELEKIKFTTSSIVALMELDKEIDKRFAYANFKILNRAPPDSKNKVFVTLGSKYLEVIDYASGIPLKVLLTSLFVPSISTKTIKMSNAVINATPSTIENGTNIFYILVNEVAVVQLPFTSQIKRQFDIVLSLPAHIRVPVSRDDVIVAEKNSEAIRTALTQLVVRCEDLKTIYPLQKAIQRYLDYTVLPENKRLFSEIFKNLMQTFKSKHILVNHQSFDMISKLLKGCIESQMDDIHKIQRELARIPSQSNIFEGKNVILVEGLSEVYTTAGLATYIFVQKKFTSHVNWAERISMTTLTDTLTPIKRSDISTTNLSRYIQGLSRNHQLPPGKTWSNWWKHRINLLESKGVVTIAEASDTSLLKTAGASGELIHQLRILLPQQSPLVPPLFFLEGKSTLPPKSFIEKMIFNDLPRFKKLVRKVNLVFNVSSSPDTDFKWDTLNPKTINNLKIVEEIAKQVVNLRALPRPKSLQFQEALYQLYLRSSALDTRFSNPATSLRILVPNIPLARQDGGLSRKPWFARKDNDFQIYAQLMGEIIGVDDAVTYAYRAANMFSKCKPVISYGYVPQTYLDSAPSLSQRYRSFVQERADFVSKQWLPWSEFDMKFNEGTSREPWDWLKGYNSPGIYDKVIAFTRNWNVYIVNWNPKRHMIWSPIVHCPILSILKPFFFANLSKPYFTKDVLSIYAMHKTYLICTSQLMCKATKYVQNCFEFVLLLEVWRFVNSGSEYQFTYYEREKLAFEYVKKIEALEPAIKDILMKRMTNVIRLQVPQGISTLFGTQYSMIAFSPSYTPLFWCVDPALLSILSGIFKMIVADISKKVQIPPTPSDVVKLINEQKGSDSTFTENKLIDYVTKYDLPSSLHKVFKNVQRYKPPAKLKLQIAEIAINEGSTKGFINSIMTETVQNSLDAIHLSNPSNKTIDIRVTSIDKNLLYSITDYVGLPDSAIIPLMIPFLSTKTPSAIITGEMGSGFFNIYRKTKVVVIRSVRDKRLITIRDYPLRDKEGRTIDIRRNVKISKTTEANHTSIYALIPTSSPSQYAHYAANLLYTAKNVLGLINFPIRLNGINIKAGIKTLVTTPHFELLYVTPRGKVTLKEIVGSEHKEAWVQLSNGKWVDVYEYEKVGGTASMSKSPPDGAFTIEKAKYEQYLLGASVSSIPSYIFTKGVPFAPLRQYFINKGVVQDWVINGLSNNIVLNILHGVFTPVQTRQKLNISHHNKKLLTTFLYESLYMSTLKTVVDGLYKGNIDLVFDNFSSATSLSQVIERPPRAKGALNIFQSIDPSDVGTLATFMLFYRFRGELSVGDYLWSAWKKIGSSQIDRETQNSLLEFWESLRLNPFTGFSFRIFRITYPLGKSTHISTLVQRAALMWLANKNPPKERHDREEKEEKVIVKRNINLSILHRTFSAYVATYWRAGTKLNIPGYVGVEAPKVGLRKIDPATIAFYDPSSHFIGVNKNFSIMTNTGKVKQFTECFSQKCSDQELFATDVWKQYFRLCLPASTFPHELEHARRSSSHEQAGAHSSIKIQFIGDDSPRTYTFNEGANKVCTMIYTESNFMKDWHDALSDLK